MRKKKKIVSKPIETENVVEVVEEKKIEKVEKKPVIAKKQEPVKIINAISVIIPACNNAENTKKLVEELILQKVKYYPETEIIVVENNSTEDMSFLDNYKEIKVVHEKEGGVSHARNVGLDMARGEYITFIDNDDFVDRSYLCELYVAMRKTKCDWCLMSWKTDGNATLVKEVPAEPLKVQWGCIYYCYNRRIINDKRFDEKLNVGEDIEWLYRVITPETKGAVLPRTLYFYSWANNENSLSHKFNRGEIPRERQ